MLPRTGRVAGPDPRFVLAGGVGHFFVIIGGAGVLAPARPAKSWNHLVLRRLASLVYFAAIIARGSPAVA